MRFKREHKLKVISVVLATTLWYFVVWGKPVEKIIEVPLFYKVNKPGYLIEINPKSVLIKVSGTRNSFRKLSESFLKITLDLSQYLPVSYEKVYQVRVPVETLNLPPEVKLKEVNPRYITVIIKRLILKKVPVKVNFLKGLPKQEKIYIIPPQVLVKGAVSLVKKFKKLDTEPINFSVLKTKKEIEVKLKYPPEIISVVPEKVKVVLKSSGGGKKE